MDGSGGGRERGFRAPRPDEDVPVQDVSGPDGPTDRFGPRAAGSSAPGSSAPGSSAPGSPTPPASANAEVLQGGPPPATRRRAEPDADVPAGTPTAQLRPARSASWRWLIAAGGVLVVAIVVIAVLAFRLGSTRASDPAAGSTSSPNPSEASSSARAGATPLPTTELYQRLAPSVVLITTSRGSLGSGTVVTDTGTILTANHVISGGGQVSVQFADGTKTTAKVQSRSTATDTATLVPAELPEVVVAATVGGGAAVGADVVAIGNPLGLRDSTSTGVVSGLGRTNKTSAGTITGLIQFDASVNPGSSGGPLLDDHGNLIGVVLSIADPGADDAFAGIGFAVPIGSALGGGDGTGAGGGPQL